MTDDNRRTKAQAVFFSVVMLLSIVGGSVAIAGSAAAEIDTRPNLSEDLVQGGGEFQVNGTVNTNGTIHAFIDVSGSDDFNSQEDIRSTEGGDYVSDFNSDNSYSLTLNAPEESGTYDVFVFQNVDEDTTGDSIPDGDSSIVEASDTIDVDANNPNVSAVSPEDGAVVNDVEQEIVFDVEDDQSVDIASANEDLDLVVDLESGGTSDTFVIDPVDGANTEGITYDTDAGTLTIEPGTGDVPALDEIDDGSSSVSATVTATDEAGNSNETTLDFDINDGDLNFDLSGVDAADPTNDVNTSFTVDVTATGPALNDSASELTISGPEYDLTLTDENNSYVDPGESGGEFDIDPQEYDDIPALDQDGTYTVTFSAADEAGTTGSASESFRVDTDAPGVSGITFDFSSDPVNENIADEEITVNFNQTVDTDTVSADITAGKSTVDLDNSNLVETDDSVTFDADGELSSLGKVDDDEAVVNVTAASDEAGNELANADADASNATFAIDTVPPQVTVDQPETNGNGEVSGLTNFEEFISGQQDVDDLTAEIYVGDEQSASLDVTDDADSVPTQDLPDGEHRFVVEVEDENGNTASDEETFTLNNDQPFEISSDYLPGFVTPVSEDVDAEPAVDGDIFTNAEDGTQFRVNGDRVAADTTISGDEFNGETVNVTAENGDTEFTVQIAFDQFVGVESNGRDVTVNVQTSEEIEEGDVMNLTVQDDDDYFEGVDVTFTDRSFEELDAENNIYTTTVEAPRDGTHEVTVQSDDVGVGLTRGNTDQSSDSGTVDVDAEDPKAETAFLTGSDGDTTDVRVEFNEPVESVGDVTFDGSGDAVEGSDDAGDGVLNVTLNGEVQTNDAPPLNVSSVTEATGDGTTLEEDASTEVATANFDLTADGLNVISLPAEAGSVPLEDSALDTTDAGGEDGLVVFGYDAASDSFDESFSPGAEENTLTELEGGEGYIVTVEEDITAEFNVQNVPSEELQAPQSQQISEGYNLIGHYQEGQQSVGQALTYLDTTYDIERGYSGVQVSALEPGEGYWLFSNGGGTHAPVNYGGVASEQPQITNVQVTDATGDGVVQPDEEIEIVATVDHDSEVAVEATVGTVSSDGTVSLSKDSEGTYSGTVTADSVDEETGTVSISVNANDADGNLGTSSVDVETDTTSNLVTNTVTGTQYSSLSAALSEVQAQETLELSNGTFVEDRDEISITTSNIRLVGQGTEETEIAADVTVEGDFVEIEDISYVANSPTGSVIVDGDDATLNQVNAEDSIEVNGASATVSNSQADTVTITGSEASVSNSQATSVTIEADDTSVTGGSAETITIADGSTGSSISGTQTSEGITDESGNATTSDIKPADGVVVNPDTGETFDSIQNAVGNASTDDTLRVGAGTFNESVTIDVEGLTLEGPNAGIAGDSDDRGAEAVVNLSNSEVVSVGATGVTINGLSFEFADRAVYSESGSSDSLYTNNRFEMVDGESSDNYAIRIEGDTTGTDVTDSLFTDIESTDNIEGDNVNGVVVRSPNGTTISGNVFSSVDTAVNAGYKNPEAGTFVVENNEFSNITQFGAVALVNDDAGLNADINNNTIESSRIGIGVFAGSSDATFSIQDNEFQNFANDEVFVDDQAGVLTLDDVLNNQGNTFDPNGEVDNNQIVVS